MARVKQTANKAKGAPSKQLRPGVAKKLNSKEVATNGIKASAGKTRKPNQSVYREDEESEELGSSTQTPTAVQGSGDVNDRPKKARKLSVKGKARVYRKLARRCGYLSRTSSPEESRGYDSSQCLLSVNDAARLMRFNPCKVGMDVAYSDYEKSLRDLACNEGAPTGAAKAIQIHGDRLLREVVNKCVRMQLDCGMRKVNAGIVLATIREKLPRLALSVGPINKGLRIEAQKRKLITNVTDDDTAAIAAWDKSCAPSNDAIRAAARKKKANKK